MSASSDCCRNLYIAAEPTRDSSEVAAAAVRAADCQHLDSEATVFTSGFGAIPEVSQDGTYEECAKEGRQTSDECVEETNEDQLVPKTIAAE